MFARYVVVALLMAGSVAVVFAQDEAPAEATTAAAAVDPTTTVAAPAVEGSGAVAADAVPDATTTAPAAGNGTKCEGFKLCNKPDECGADGTCLGAFVGKCNCNACINFWTCKDDSACGGLKGACDAKTSTCRCWETLEKAGFPFIKAATELCNVKECSTTSRDACLGLPCQAGRCVCKAPAKDPKA